MQITERNFNKIMKIEDLSKRKAKLQEFCMSIGWHGGIWESAMNELKKIRCTRHKNGFRKKSMPIKGIFQE